MNIDEARDIVEGHDLKIKAAPDHRGWVISKDKFTQTHIGVASLGRMDAERLNVFLEDFKRGYKK